MFKSLERKDYEGALQYNDYLVIQIDTDVQEEPGFDVPRREGASELLLADRVARVVARLKRDIDAVFYQANEHRILFAVAVDTIECWLLPLLYSGKKRRRRGVSNRRTRRFEKPTRMHFPPGRPSSSAHMKKHRVAIGSARL